MNFIFQNVAFCAYSLLILFWSMISTSTSKRWSDNLNLLSKVLLSKLLTYFSILTVVFKGRISSHFRLIFKHWVSILIRTIYYLLVYHMCCADGFECFNSVLPYISESMAERKCISKIETMLTLIVCYFGRSASLFHCFFHQKYDANFLLMIWNPKHVIVFCLTGI